MARTGASKRRAIVTTVAASGENARFLRRAEWADFRRLLTLFSHHRGVLTSRSHAHPLRRALIWTVPRPGWTSAGVLALLCSGVAWASFPRAGTAPLDEQRQWQALGVAPLANGGVSGMPMAPTEAVETVDFVPKRALPPEAPVAVAKPNAV